MYGWLLACCLILGSSGSSSLNCCDETAQWIQNTSNCSDGRSIKIDCPVGFFLIQPSIDPAETFRVFERDNASWLSIEDEHGQSAYEMPPASFCVGKESSEQAIALVCFPEDDQPAIWHDLVFGLCSMLSSVFLGLTLLVYLLLPEMRDIQDKAMMSVTGSFMVAFFLTGNQQLSFPPLEEDVTCLFMAFIMYYAYLCAFFWLNIISLNIWRATWFPNIQLQSNVLFIVYCMIGWGLPLCFLAASLTTHHVEGYHLRPGFGENSCWFNGYYATWVYFYGPILVLLTINMLYLAMTSWKLWHEFKGLDSCKLKVLRFKCAMYVKLALMMGFTWIFEIISFAAKDTNRLYWIFPDLLNVLQGLFIFILFVVMRKRVRKALATRRPFNIPFPKSWAAYADEEICDPVGIEEVEMS